jgi:hypothetical protein
MLTPKVTELNRGSAHQRRQVAYVRASRRRGIDHGQKAPRLSVSARWRQGQTVSRGTMLRRIYAQELVRERIRAAQRVAILRSAREPSRDDAELAQAVVVRPRQDAAARG